MCQPMAGSSSTMPLIFGARYGMADGAGALGAGVLGGGATGFVAAAAFAATGAAGAGAAAFFGAAFAFGFGFGFPASEIGSFGCAFFHASLPALSRGSSSRKSLRSLRFVAVSSADRMSKKPFGVRFGPIPVRLARSSLSNGSSGTVASRPACISAFGRERARCAMACTQSLSGLVVSQAAFDQSTSTLPALFASLRSRAVGVVCSRALSRRTLNFRDRSRFATCSAFVMSGFAATIMMS